MIKLDISRLHILAEEQGSTIEFPRLYVVKKEEDGKYNDPLTCQVRLTEQLVAEPDRFHNYLKFCYPVSVSVDQKIIEAFKVMFLTLPAKEQRKLMMLYDPGAGPAISPNNQTMEQYVKQRLPMELSAMEFTAIDAGFRLLWDHTDNKWLKPEEYKRSVFDYLNSIELPIDEEKASMTVELMLEYLDRVGMRGKEIPF